METIGSRVLPDDELDAKYMLVSTLVVGIGLFVLQLFLYLTCPISDYPLAYIAPMGIIVASNVASLFVVRKSLSLMAYGFCSIVMGCVSFMAFTALRNGEIEYPVILSVLPVCAYGLAYFTTTRQMLPFLAVTIITLLVFGIVFNAIDSAVPSIAASVIGSILVSRLKTQLYQLRTAIRILTNGRRRNQEYIRRLAAMDED